MIPSSKVLAVSLIASFQFIPCISSGSLGGRADSVQKDRKFLEGSEKIIPKECFKVHEINSNGNRIREYVSPDNKVFAVTWRGISQPDLSVLFGDYYEDFKKAAARQKRHRRGEIKVVRTKKIVVEKSGHMRDVRGKAYIPTLFPNGVSAVDIT